MKLLPNLEFGTRRYLKIFNIFQWPVKHVISNQVDLNAIDPDVFSLRTLGFK